MLIALGMAFSVCTAIAAVLLSRLLITWVTGNESADAIVCGVRALRWAALFLPPLYLLCIMRAFLQNMGYAIAAMCSGVSELLTRVAACLILPNVLGETTAYITEELGWLVTFGYLIVCHLVVSVRKAKRS